MIKSFKCRDTKLLFETGKSRRFSAVISVASRKLDIIDYATKLLDLRVPPGNRLEALSGNRKGQHSIRINKQWRICFVWHNNEAFDVEITDYH